jgi:hypothetical protein
MLVTFRSKAAGSITMFGEHATQLLQLMGASGRVPGALNAADVPIALRGLQAGLQAMQTPAPPALNEDRSVDDADEDQQPAVALAIRASPLLDLLQRAAAANAEVLWEKTA